MFEKESSSERQELMPWYVNGTLSQAEKRAVEDWLRQNPQARAELAAWRQLRAAVMSQPQEMPSAAARARVMARVRAQDIHRQAAPAPWWAWAWSVAIAAAVLILLWTAVRPGVILEWSVSGGPVTAFRIYRAPQGSADFYLLRQVPARPDVQRYAFVDGFLLPGRSYVYRVEGVGQTGQMVESIITASDTLLILPYQLAVLVTGLVSGYIALVLARQWRPVDAAASARAA